jgi:hypothetical protein
MAAWAEGLAVRCGQVEAIEQVATAISEGVGEDLLSLQWLMRGHLKACELAESLVEDFLSQRFISARAMTRALLDGAATLAWVMDEPKQDERLARAPVPAHQLRGAAQEGPRATDARPDLPALGTRRRCQATPRRPGHARHARSR